MSMCVNRALARSLALSLSIFLENYPVHNLPPRIMP